METLAELRNILKRLEAKWDSGTISDPHEIIRLDKQMKEIKKKIQTLNG